MAEYIDKVRAMNIIASGKNDNAYFGTTSKDWEVIDFLKTVPTANVIPIPRGATNGDMIKAMFNIPDSEIDEGLSTTYLYTNTRVLKGGSQDYLREQITFNRDWWNAPYKKR